MYRLWRKPQVILGGWVRLVGRMRALALALGLGLTAGGAWAQASVEDLFKNAQFLAATLSPNGRYLAATANIDGQYKLLVSDLQSSKTTNLASYKFHHIVNLHWVSDDRILYSLGEAGYGEGTGGFFAIDRDGSHQKELASVYTLVGILDVDSTSSQWNTKPYRFEKIHDTVAADPQGIAVAGKYINGEMRAFRMDVQTGRLRDLEYGVSGLVKNFVVDNQHVVRMVTISNDANSSEALWYRAALDQPWRQLLSQPTIGRAVEPLAFDADDKTLLVSAPTPSGYNGIYKFDFDKNQLGELLAADPNVSIAGDLVLAPDSRKVLGVRVASEPPRTIWFDKTYADLQGGIDVAMPGKVNRIDPGNAGAPVLVFSYSSTDSGRYYTFEPSTKKLRQWLALRPWIDPKKMAVQLAYDYKARDGLPILAYLTLPRGKAPKALPMVVLVHGGPYARDVAGFDPQVQFLAGLGYAVLQPQFRGSKGFGYAHWAKSFGQWGLSMQDDLSDGVSSLVKQGVVDPQRVCIMGASYGGYAVMQGLVKTPDQYRCGVNLFGVTDLFYISASKYFGDAADRYYMDKTLGNSTQLKVQFEATSPVYHADQIKAPVYMVYGEKDHIVPRVHGQDMRDALKKANKVYEYTELDEVWHGMVKEQDKFKVYTAIAAFLKKYNPPD